MIPSHRTATPLRGALRLPGGKRRARISAANTANTTTTSITMSTSSTTVTQAASSLTVAQTVTTSTSTSSSQITAEQAIQSLCQAFSKKCSTSCFGFVEHEDTRYYFYPVKQLTTLDATKPITLEQLLCEGNLSRRQRYSLALTLASSFLQLRGSVWMRSALGKAEISFLRDGMNPNVLLLDRPYITRDFSRREAQSTGQDNLIGHINTLGVTMIELCFGAPIETFGARKQYPLEDEKSKSVFDLLAAVEMANNLVEEAGPDYTSAVEWCLLGSRKMPAGENWRREFCSEVVSPLELAYQYLNSTTSKARAL